MNGYTAITALAFVLRIIAISVVKIIDLIFFPKIIIPLASSITSGTLTISFLNSVVILGTNVFSIYTSLSSRIHIVD